MTICTDHAGSRARVIEGLQGAQAAITMRDSVTFDSAVLWRVPGLRLLSVCGDRLAPQINLRATATKGILVAASAPSAVALAAQRPVVEVTWAFILGLMKEMVITHGAIRASAWNTRASRGVAGNTRGLAGFGKIGQRVFRVVQNFGVRMLASRPNLTDARAEAAGAKTVSLEDFRSRRTSSPCLRLRPLKTPACWPAPSSRPCGMASKIAGAYPCTHVLFNNARAQHAPMKRVGLVEACASAALLPACDDSGYMTGSIITVDRSRAAITPRTGG